MRAEIAELCRKTFRETVKHMNMNPELRRALKTHERVPVFIDNLAGQLSTTKFKVTKEHIIKATQDLTKTFVQLVERQNQERVMSDIAKMTIKGKMEAKQKLSRDADILERLGTDEVIQDEKGTTLKQTIRIDKDLEKVLET